MFILLLLLKQLQILSSGLQNLEANKALQNYRKDVSNNLNLKEISLQIIILCWGEKEKKTTFLHPFISLSVLPVPGLFLSVLKPDNTTGRERNELFSGGVIMNCMFSCLFPLGLFYELVPTKQTSHSSLTTGSLVSSGFYFSRTVTNLKASG